MTHANVAWGAQQRTPADCVTGSASSPIDLTSETPTSSSKRDDDEGQSVAKPELVRSWFISDRGSILKLACILASGDAADLDRYYDYLIDALSV